MLMKINILRGSNQIGGNIIEVATTSTKVLWMSVWNLMMKKTKYYQI